MTTHRADWAVSTGPVQSYGISSTLQNAVESVFRVRSWLSIPLTSTAWQERPGRGDLPKSMGRLTGDDLRKRCALTAHLSFLIHSTLLVSAVVEGSPARRRSQRPPRHTISISPAVSAFFDPANVALCHQRSIFRSTVGAVFDSSNLTSLAFVPCRFETP